MAIHPSDEYVIGLFATYAAGLEGRDPSGAKHLRDAVKTVREVLAESAKASPGAHALCGSRCIGGDPRHCGG